VAAREGKKGVGFPHEISRDIFIAFAWQLGAEPETIGRGCPG
jgi:hypothetical protein